MKKETSFGVFNIGALLTSYYNFYYRYDKEYAVPTIEFHAD